MNIVKEQLFKNKITIISFACSLCVMWIHAGNLDTYGISSESNGIGYITYIVEIAFGKVIVFATPFFFFISGFLFFRNYSLDRTLVKYKKRIKSILIPYLMWCSIYYFYFVAITNLPIISRFVNSNKYELSVSGWLASLWSEQYYTLWFLKDLIVYIAITPLLYILLKNWKRMPVGFFFLVLLMNLGHLIRNFTLPQGFYMYAAGSYLAINHNDMALRTDKRFSMVGVLLILFMVFTDFRYLNVNTQVLLFVSVWYAMDIMQIGSGKGMPYWMKLTFFTYVAHDMFLEAIEKVWFWVFGIHPFWALIDYLIMPIVTLCILVFISKFLNKYLLGVWNVLNGYR